MAKKKYWAWIHIVFWCSVGINIHSTMFQGSSFHDQHEDIRASFIWMIPPTSCIKSEFLSCSSEFHRNLPKDHPQTTLKSPIFNLEAISEAHVHLFSMDFPCQIHGKTWKTWAPTPRVACFPGSPVAGLCTEEAVTTTRAVGDKLGSILGMLGCGVCCWWCWERRSLMI